MTPTKNIVLAGLGPHARRIYYPLLEKYAAEYNIRLLLVIDRLEQRQAVDSYLQGRSLQPEQRLFIDDNPNMDETPGEELLTTLRDLSRKHHISGIIIATEPRAHKFYA